MFRQACADHLLCNYHLRNNRNSIKVLDGFVCKRKRHYVNIYDDEQASFKRSVVLDNLCFQTVLISQDQIQAGQRIFIPNQRYLCFLNPYKSLVLLMHLPVTLLIICCSFINLPFFPHTCLFMLFILQNSLTWIKQNDNRMLFLKYHLKHDPFSQKQIINP